MPVDIDAVRDWIGATPDDDVIATTWARFEDQDHQVERTALAILRRRRADTATAVEAWAVDGDYSERRNAAATAKALDALIARLEAITGDTAGGGLATLTSAAIVVPRGVR